ncbi:MAG: GyrI-like domain-containing protein [Parafilimonas sp.]
MKKWIAGILIVAVLFSLATYLLIPSVLTVSNIVYCKTTLHGAYRTLITKTQWEKWWVNKNVTGDSVFEYMGDTYQLTDTYLNGAEVTIHHNIDTLKTEMRTLDLPDDSVAVTWKFSMNTSINPFKRISRYNDAVALKKNTKEILDNYKTFVEKDDNVYGISIRISSIEYTSLITTKAMFDHYPSTNEIYNKIDFLKQFSDGHSLKQTYYPMMNVTKDNDTAYRLMVALPVDTKTSFTGNIHSVEMVPGNFMITEVKGGYKTVSNALDQLQLYFQDYEKTSMAIPFEYLVTDRIVEPDTTKWITKIYAPVLR